QRQDRIGGNVFQWKHCDSVTGLDGGALIKLSSSEDLVRWYQPQSIALTHHRHTAAAQRGFEHGENFCGWCRPRRYNRYTSRYLWIERIAYAKHFAENVTRGDLDLGFLEVDLEHFAIQPLQRLAL